MSSCKFFPFGRGVLRYCAPELFICVQRPELTSALHALPPFGNKSLFSKISETVQALLQNYPLPYPLQLCCFVLWLACIAYWFNPLPTTCCSAYWWTPPHPFTALLGTPNCSVYSSPCCTACNPSPSHCTASVELLSTRP